MKELSSQQLMEMTERWAWFAPARAVLCRRALENSGPDAARSAFNDSFLHFPDAGFIASAINRSADEMFRDETIAASTEESRQTEEKPKMILVGMDYFSREEYESVSDDSLKNLGRVNFMDGAGDAIQDGGPGYGSGVGQNEGSAADEIPDLVTETLARIYAEQGYIQEAEDIYHKLSLHSPEKSAYFASLIDNLKN